MRRLPALPVVVGVGIGHLLDEPVRAVTLLLRLLPAGIRRGVVSALVALRPVAPELAAVGLWESGRHRDAAALLCRSIRPEAGQVRRNRRIARLAVALRLPDDVGRAAAEALPDDDPARARLRALAMWSAGDLVAAVQALPASDRSRTRARLDGELAVLQPHDRAGAAADAVPSRGTPGRVLHLVTNSLPHTTAGYTVRSQHIGRAQRAAALDPHFVTRLGYPATQAVWRASATDVVDGVPYHRLLDRRPLPVRADDRLAAGVESASVLVSRLRPAVLHAATDHGNGQAGIALARRHGLPVVYEVRGFLEESWLVGRPATAARSDRYRLSRAAETWCMRHADAVVTLSEAMRHEIVARGVEERCVVVVPNAVDAAMLADPPDGSTVRDRYGIPRAGLLVGTLSTFYRFEGLDVLLHAVHLLRARGVRLSALLVGDGPDGQRLRALADELGLSAAVRFTGRVPHVEARAHYAALDAVAVPRTDDRVCHLVTPLKPLEAMASGRPVVASDVGGLRDVVRHEENGLLVPPEDPMALADALERLADDRELGAELGRAARQWVAEERTWSRNGQRYRDLYGRLGAL